MTTDKPPTPVSGLTCTTCKDCVMADTITGSAICLSPLSRRTRIKITDEACRHHAVNEKGGK